MEFSAQQIAGLVGGTIEGDPGVKINDFAKIEEGRPGCISFLANPKYAHYLYETESSIVLVNKDFQLEGETKATLIRVDNAYETVAKLLTLYDSMKPKKKGIDSLAFIDPTATIGEDCYIGPFVAIGEGAVIGKGCVLHPHVTIGAKATVGDNTEIYSNAVVYHILPLDAERQDAVDDAQRQVTAHINAQLLPEIALEERDEGRYDLLAQKHGANNDQYLYSFAPLEVHSLYQGIDGINCLVEHNGIHLRHQRTDEGQRDSSHNQHPIRLHKRPKVLKQTEYVHFLCIHTLKNEK